LAVATRSLLVNCMIWETQEKKTFLYSIGIGNHHHGRKSSYLKSLVH
jgi:hypothetical protein